jgi:hypothetical protein
VANPAASMMKSRLDAMRHFWRPVGAMTFDLDHTFRPVNRRKEPTSRARLISVMKTFAVSGQCPSPHFSRNTTRKDTAMKLATVALAAAIALSSTAALAQAAETAGYGTVTAPSVGTYNWPSVGTTNAVPTWRNTTISGPSPSATNFA